MKRYNAINGLRAYSAIAIIFMHVYYNGNFQVSFFENNNIMAFINDLTFLFMVISSFSMCCGYYHEMVDNTIDLKTFYIRRYLRIIPFFSLLVVVDVVRTHTLQALIEGMADLSLVFGLLPNANISIIGVGWFLGVVFVFYIIFPFFCAIINKKTIWPLFGISVVWNIMCSLYFFDSAHVVKGYNFRTNFLYCSMFFFMGAIIFLHKEIIERIPNKIRNMLSVFTIILTLFYCLNYKQYSIYAPLFMNCIFGLCVMIAVNDSKNIILDNSFTSLVSSISLEIYLCHMLIYRVIEKFILHNFVKSSICSYLLICIIVTIGAITFSFFVKWGEKCIRKNIVERK